MNTTYAVSLVISTCISLIIALVALKRRTAPGASGLVFYMLCCAVWAATYAVRWTTFDISAQIFWLDATYFGVVGLSTAFLIFALQFTERSHVITPRSLTLFSIVPVLTLVMLWTDRWFGLFFGGIPRTTGSIFNGGPAFWLFVIYAYLLIFIAIGIFFQALWRSSGLYRLQVAAIVFAGCLPVVGNILSLAGFTPFPNLDLTPFVFMASGLIFAYGLFGFHLMDVVPIARHKLVDEMTDGIIVLDASKRIVDINPAAQRLIGISYSSIGKTFEDVLSPLLRLDLTTDPRAVVLTELRVSENPPLDIELQVLPLLDNHQKISGHLMILHDITERKQADEQLRESGELLREVGHVAKVGGWNLDLITNELTWTEETYIIHEIDQHLKPQLEDGINFYAPEARPVLQAAVERAISQGTPYDLELPFITAKGNHLWVRTIGNANVVDGRVVRLYGIFQDITESKRAEDALRDKEEQYRAIAESSSDYIMRYDRNFRHIFANQMAIKFTGLPVDQYIGKNHREMGYPAELCELWEEHIQKVFDTGRPSKVDFAVETAQGMLYLDLVFSPEFSPNGSVNSVIGISRDITDRKRVEDALRKSETKYRLLTESMKDVIWTLDPETLYFLYVSPSVERLRGFTPEEVMAEPMDAAVTPDVSEYLRMDLRQRVIKFSSGSASTDQFKINEVEQPCKDGTTVWTEVVTTLFMNEETGRVELLGVTRDITDRKRAEDKIRQLNATLEQRVEERTVELVRANRVKDEFLASMSHELRTPLNAISGYSQLLLEGLHGSVNEKQQKDLGIIRSSCDHLLGLITDILDVSKIESGQFILHLESVDVNEVCKASMVFVNQFAEQKNIEMDYSSSEDEPVILADAKRLKQILVNLLNNAVKFTPEKGRIKLEVRTDVSAGLMRFSVIDTGIGISAEDLPKLFKPFVQLDGSLSRQYQGTGLGLSLVKRLVEIQGGSVEVQSEAGVGSCFTFVLPWQNVSMDNKGRDVIVADDQNGRLMTTPHAKILIADDNEVNVMVVRDYLESFGYQVSVAFDGGEVLSKVEQEIPDVILMDIQMPYMNGLDATRRLRTDPRFVTVPIIALTALALSGDRERCFEAGMNEYMSKPVSLKEIRNVLERFLSPALSHK